MSFSPDNPQERAEAARRAREAAEESEDSEDGVSPDSPQERQEAAERAQDSGDGDGRTAMERYFDREDTVDDPADEPADDAPEPEPQVDSGASGASTGFSPDSPQERQQAAERAQDSDGGESGSEPATDDSGVGGGPVGGGVSPDSPQERQAAADRARDAGGTGEQADAPEGTSIVVSDEPGADMRNVISQERFEQIQGQTQSEIGESDLVLQDGDVRLTPSAREQEGQALQELAIETREETAQSSPAARRRMEREQREAFDEAAGELEQQLESQTGDDLSRGEDFRVRDTDGGGLTAVLTEDYRREQLRGRVEGRLEQRAGRDLEPGEDFDVDVGPGGVDQPARPTPGELESIADEGGDGSLTADVTLSPELRQELSDRGVQTDEGRISSGQRPSGDSTVQTDADGDVLSGVVAGIEGGLSEVAQVASGDESTTVEFRGDGSAIQNAQQELDSSGVDLTADLGPVSDVGDALTEAGETVQSEVIDPVAGAAAEGQRSVAGDVLSMGLDPVGSAVGVTRNLAGEAQENINVAQSDGARAAAEELLATDAEDIVEPTGTRDQRAEVARGAAEGGLGIANLPALGGTVVGAGEFAVAGGEAAASGEGGEFATTAASAGIVAGGGAARFAAENPVRFAGQVAGSAVASSAILRGAQAVGGARTTQAAAFGIQPGEEIAIAAARRGVPGASRLAGAVGDVDAETRADVDTETTVDQTATDLPDERPQTLTAEDVDTGTGTATRPPDAGEGRAATTRQQQSAQTTRDPPLFGDIRQSGGLDWFLETRAARLGRELAEDESARLQMTGRGRRSGVDRGGRGETEPEFDPARPGANGFDLELAQRRLDQASRREVTADETVGQRADVRETAGTRGRGEIDADADPIVARRRAAQRREVTDADADVPGGTATLTGVLAGTGLRTQAAEAQTVGVGEATEPRVDVAEAQQPSVTEDVDTGLETGVEPSPRFEIDTGLRTEMRSETDQRQEVEQRQETRQDQRQETRQDSRQETRQEFRAEQRQELRRETRQEARFETRREVNVDPERRDSGDDDDDDGGFGSDVGVVLTEFADPLSGEVPSADQIDADIPGLFER